MIFFSETRKITAGISSVSKLNPRHLGISSGFVRPSQIQREERGQGLQTLARLEGICGEGGQRQPRGSREQLQVESSQAGHEDHELNTCLGSRARFLQKKTRTKRGVVIYSYNFNTQEIKAGRYLGWMFVASLVHSIAHFTA